MTEDENIVGNLSTLYSDKPVIRSLLQLIPGWAAADTLLIQRANEIRSDRLRTFFDELASGKFALTEEVVREEDFLHSYFCTLRAVTSTRQREKIKLFARLLDSSFSPEKSSSVDEFEEMLDILDGISLREFAVLYELHQLESSHLQKEGENNLQHTLHYWNTFKDLIVTKYDVPEHSFNAFMAKIERTGLYLRITGGLLDYSGDVGNTTPLFSRLLELVVEGAQQTH